MEGDWQGAIERARAHAPFLKAQLTLRCQAALGGIVLLRGQALAQQWRELRHCCLGIGQHADLDRIVFPNLPGVGIDLHHGDRVRQRASTHVQEGLEQVQPDHQHHDHHLEQREAGPMRAAAAAHGRPPT